MYILFFFTCKHLLIIYAHAHVFSLENGNTATETKNKTKQKTYTTNKIHTNRMQAETSRQIERKRVSISGQNSIKKTAKHF